MNESNGTAAAPVVSSGTGGQPAAAAGQKAAPAAPTAEAIDLGHRDQARSALRVAWGNEGEQNVVLINRYLDSLPAKQREELEGRVLADGRRALHDPATLRELAANARGGPVPQDHIGLIREIQKLEHFMNTNRTAYNRSPEIQARLRDCYRARDGE